MAALPSTTTENAPKTQPWQHLVAGAVAGALAKTVTAPIERIKLLMQLADSLPANGSSNALSATIPKRNQQSAWTLTKYVYRTEGIRSFWRGNWPSVLRTSGTAAVNFTTMDYYKRLIARQLLENESNSVTARRRTSIQPPHLFLSAQQQRLASSLLSGGLAGATATTLLYPFEFARTRLAADTGSQQDRQFGGMRDVLRKMIQHDGFLGLYQGYAVALVGGIWYRVLFLGGYDALKTEILHYKVHHRSRAPISNETAPTLLWWERVLSAQTISIMAGTLSYPFDSVRRRMMMQTGKAPNERAYRHAVDCVRKVWNERGIQGFYMGIGPNLVRSVSGALLLVAYDVVKAAL